MNVNFAAMEEWAMDPTIAVFDKNAVLYQQKYMDQSRYAKGLDRCVELAGAGSVSMIDLGCGPGNVSRYLLDRKPGWKVLAVDLSPAMVELAIQNLPEAECRIGDVKSWHQWEGRYQLVVVGFCIPYLKRDEVQNLIATAKEKMNDGSVLYLSFMEGEYERSGYQLSSNGEDKAFIHYYMAEEIVSVLKEYDFVVDTLLRTDFLKADGSIDIDVQIVAVRESNTY